MYQHHPVKNIAPPTTQKGPDDVFFVVECQINDRTAPPPAIRDIALMSGGILCKGVVLKVHRVINYNSMYIIIGYDINTPLMTMYEIMTLCKHRMTTTTIKDNLSISRFSFSIPRCSNCCGVSVSTLLQPKTDNDAAFL